MKKILWNDKGFISIIDEVNGLTLAVTQTSSRPVNLKAMPAEAAIFIDKKSFDKMCMDYVRAKGETALIAAAEATPSKEASLLALAGAALTGLAAQDRLGYEDIPTKAVAIARETYSLLEDK